MSRSYYHRIRDEIKSKEAQKQLSILQMHINRVEKILSSKNPDIWPMIQDIIKEKIERLQHKRQDFAKMTEIDLKLNLKQEDDLQFFHDIYEQLEYELKELKIKYEQVNAKLQTDQKESVT